MRYQHELSVALDAVRKAIAVCEAVARGKDTPDAVEKEDRTPVTIADFGSQAVVCRMIRSVFPEDSIVAEETPEMIRRDKAIGKEVFRLVRNHTDIDTLAGVIGAIDIGAGTPSAHCRFWALDPIDGTKGFLRGDQYAVALALVDHGDVVLGVLGCPNLPIDPQRSGDKKGCIFQAVRGSGARVEPLTGDGSQSIHVDSISDPKTARFCESYESAHASHDSHQKISAAMGFTHPSLRMDSQAKYAAVGRGDASLYLRIPKDDAYREKIWDHAAGSIIVEEAGGRVTDFLGRPIDYTAGKQLENNRGIVATNGYLHQAALDAISRVMGLSLR